MSHSYPLLSRRQIIGGVSIAALAAGLPSCAMANGFLYVEDFRKRSMSDREVITAAIEALGRRGGGVLEFGRGRTYLLGDVEPSQAIFHLRNLAGVELRGNGARLVCHTLGGQTQLFLVQLCKGLTFRGLQASDTGVDLRREWRGMDFVHLETTAGPISEVLLENVEVDRAVSLLTCTGLGTEPRARGIRFVNVIARNCYYGLTFQENGDDVAGDLTAINCRRAYFPYGVRDHSMRIDVSHDMLSPGGDACILIKRYLRDTGRISVSARFGGTLNWSNLVKLEQQPPEGETGTIESVSIRLDVDPQALDPWNAAPLAIEAYRRGKPAVRSMDIWRDITLESCFGPASRAVAYRTIPDKRPSITVRSECEPT